jgi:choline dehydrogenase
LHRYLGTNNIFGNNSNYKTSDPADGYNYASIAAVLAAPLSRGNISINSSDMADAPLINPNWLTHPVDVEVMVAAFKRTRDMWAAISDQTIGGCSTIE